jgi:glutamate 5-kinase
MTISNKKRLVIKIGSALLVQDGKVRSAWLKSLAQDVATLRRQGKEVIIVSSGAIALGRCGIDAADNLKLAEKQASAAIGQINLMAKYQDIFAQNDLNVAQILLIAEDEADKRKFANAKNTIKTLLKNNIVPIINENDTVATDEIKIGDNDRLAAMIAKIADADLLILLSDIDGLYDKNPKINDDAQFIAQIDKIDSKIEKMATGSVSKVGTGGMKTKIAAAKMANQIGCETIICNGQDNNPIARICFGGRFSIFRI